MTIANPYFFHPKSSLNADQSLKRRAALAGLCVAIALIIAKFAAFLMTNAVSILSSLMDSVFDAGASLVTLLGITHAAYPADHDHRFGHGKIEALSALAQAVFILGSGIFLFFESIRRFISPQPVGEIAAGVGIMVFAVILTGALVLFQRHVIRKTKSVAIEADHLHYSGDILMNTSVIIALLLSYGIDWPYFDPLFALCIALRLMWGAGQISKQSFDILLDKELPETERQNIIDLINADKDIKGIHDLRTRTTGERYFMEFHVEVDKNLTITAVHDIMDRLEKKIFKAYPQSEVLIHPEPEGLDDHRLDDVINET